MNKTACQDERSRGVALMLVMIAMMMGTILALSFLSTQTTSTAVEQNIRHHASARAIAESALAMAIYHVQNSATWRTDHTHGVWASNVAFAGGTYNISGEDGYDIDGDGQISGTETDGDLADDATDVVTLTAQGWSAGVLHQVQVKIVPGTRGGDAGFAAVGKIELSDSATLDGYNGTASVSTNSTSNASISVEGNATIDGDVYVGPGGNPASVIKLSGNGQITGSQGVEAATVSITAPAQPALGPSVGDVSYNGGTTTLSSDLHVDGLELKGNATLQIANNITIIVEEEFEMSGNAKLILLPGASLTLFVKTQMQVTGNAKLNANTSDPDALTLYHTGSGLLTLSGNSEMYATLVATVTQFNMSGSSEFWGMVRANAIKLQGASEVHVSPSQGGSGGGSGGGDSVQWIEP